MAIVPVYKLKIRYDVEKYELDDSEPRPYPRHTNERLTIEDTIDLETGMQLTKLLAILDRVHASIAEILDA